ncbi:MAG: hypothetical protein GF320_18670 [Armatimonadia bacterium]|nr:hypothetical protein [Armatimonadia bacterium]
MSAANVRDSVLDEARAALQELDRQFGVRSEVVPDGAHQDGSWWFVPFRLTTGSPSARGYYEALAEAEEHIESRVGTRVLLVPSV